MKYGLFVCIIIMMNNSYRFEKDVYLVAQSLDLPLNKIALEAKIPESTFYCALKEGHQSKNVLEAFYSYAYKKGLRLNKAKEEIYRENLHKRELLLFHGSSYGVEEIDPHGSREDCDFSRGFYCGESYSSALCFVEGDSDSSVYIFKADLKGLKTLELDSSLEWMLSICYHRGMLKQYSNHEKLLEIIRKEKNCDVIIAPIADNKMYRVMQLFGQGKITDLEAIHALSASRLGKQYLFRTEKATSKLFEVERLYLSSPEKEASIASSVERAYEIETKLNLAKREYRKEGRYVEEIFQ